MSDDVTLRDATRADAEAIQRVARDSCHAVYDSIFGSDRTTEIVETWYAPETLVSDDIDPDERPFFVAEVDGRVVGFVEGIPDEDGQTANLYRIYIVPDHWGDGVGGALLDRLESVFAARGFDRLLVSVLADNETGVGFYEAVGFEHVETVRDEQFDVKRAKYAKPLP
ncbi:GNAT family N-acetyltransferase [Haloarchaeobius sp. DFWS5]|uniref:GNAT family N-acetyltransferase n=1 Tax=Haloarchaeobius sp. DFWS5 TaxID=3446114 RepID=UPI003EB76D40